MIVIMAYDTPILKELGHPSIPPRMFGLRQYLVTPPIQLTKLTKPKVTLKPLPSTSDARGSAKAEVGPINHFVHWFQTISAYMNVEVQSASWEAASSVLANEWYEGKSDAVEASPVQSDQRRVEYSAEMAEIGFPSQGQDQSYTRDLTMDQQHQLNQL